MKAKLETAWWNGSMHHIDPKKYPKKPALLWDKDADNQSAEAMIQIAMAMATNGQEFRATFDKKKLN